MRRFSPFAVDRCLLQGCRINVVWTNPNLRISHYFVGYIELPVLKPLQTHSTLERQVDPPLHFDGASTNHEEQGLVVDPNRKIIIKVILLESFHNSKRQNFSQLKINIKILFLK